MEIVAITETHWDEHAGEMVDTGAVVSYEARNAAGNILGQGETVAEAIGAALSDMYRV